MSDKDIKYYIPLKAMNKKEYAELFPDLSKASKLMDEAPVTIEMAYLPKETNND